MIDSQLAAGYESSSGFRDAFTQIMGDAPTKMTRCILKATWIDTKLGPMLSITDDDGLYLLEFVDRRGLELEIERLRKRLKAAIIPGETTITKMLINELENYFQGKDFKFETPLHLIGSDFQKKVWHTLQNIPAGQTRSYLDIAKMIEQPKACRAVARANGTNQIAILIPCHRVINSNGDIGGYGGGMVRKQWLLNHEKKDK